MSKSNQASRKNPGQHHRIAKSLDALRREMLSRAKNYDAALGLLDQIRDVRASLNGRHHWMFAHDLWTATRFARTPEAVEWSHEAIRDKFKCFKPWTKRRLRQLSEQAGGWWDFFDSGWPMKSEVPVFVTTADWQTIYAEHVRTIQNTSDRRRSQPRPAYRRVQLIKGDARDIVSDRGFLRD